MLKDITFGQYFNASSVIHRLDPRTKLVLLIVSIVFLFVTKNMFGLALFGAFILAIMILSTVPIKMFLKNIKAILPIVIFTALLNLFYGTEGDVLYQVWKLTITTGSVYKATYMALRIVLLILLSSVLTYTTTPNDLTDAIEKLLSPLKFIGLKSAVHTLAMMMTIALRFIPTLVEETQKIMNAQKARGADLENGKITERIRALIPILIPLLISSVRRAYELAEAMECRCYNGGEGRQRMKQLRYSRLDVFAFIITAIIGALVIIFNIIL